MTDYAGQHFVVPCLGVSRDSDGVYEFRYSSFQIILRKTKIYFFLFISFFWILALSLCDMSVCSCEKWFSISEQIR